MISFDKLFNEVMKDENISTYRLYQYLGVSRSQIYRRKDSKVQIATLDRILQILFEETGKVYQLSDICTFIPEQQKNEEE